MISAAGMLLDTNVISELRKGSQAHTGLLAWLNVAAESSLFLSVITIGEIRKGIERVRKRDIPKAATLEVWLGGLDRRFADRVLPVTGRIADRWGRLQAIRSLPEIDAFLAATALEHNLTLVTRHEADFEGLGLSVINPFFKG